MAKVLGKPPSLTTLIQLQKQQQKILNPISLSSKQKLSKQGHPSAAKKQQPNPWQSIHSTINASEQVAQELKKLPLRHSYAQVEYEIEMVRNQVARNRLRVWRLRAERDRAKEDETKSMGKLEGLLAELEKLEKEFADSGPNIQKEEPPKQKGRKSELRLPDLSQFFKDSPKDYSQRFLKPTQTSHSTCKPIDFFNILSSRVLETDREISFLLSKQYKQQVFIQQLTTQQKTHTQHQSTLQNTLHNLHTQQKSLKIESTKLQHQLQHITNPSYIATELEQRVRQQQILYSEECKRMYANVMKLWKVIELAGNREVIGEAEIVLQRNGISI